jgi:hypothetical protein
MKAYDALPKGPTKRELKFQAMREETEGDQKDTVVADLPDVNYNHSRTFKPMRDQNKKLIPEYHNPLEFYTLETRARISVQEILQPIFSDIEADRKYVQVLDMHYQHAERRLEKLEYTLGLNRKKKP